MKVSKVLSKGMIVLGIFLAGSAGTAAAGGSWSGAAHEGKHLEKRAEASAPVMVSDEYLEYLQSQKVMETGGFTEQAASRQERRSEAKSEVGAPVMASSDYLEYLESQRGIETGSLTAAGSAPTIFHGASEPLVIPEGG